MLDFPFDFGLLLVVGFIVGIINTLAGGGSLITLPLLIFLGLPPQVANGTNRIAILFYTSSATLGFRTKKVNTFPFSIYMGVAAMFGAILGAKIAIDIDDFLFNRILAIVMIAVVLFIVFKQKYNYLKTFEKTTGKSLIISAVAFFFIGIYGGFINAGIGYIMMFFMSYFNRMSLIRVNAAKVTIALIYTIAAFLTFLISGMVDWEYGIALSIGSAFGAFVTSRYSVKKGEGIIKVVMLVMVFVMAAKLWFF